MEWSVLFSVVTINLLLSSDNALAIAMASRRLAPEYRQKAVRWGSICAVVLQIVITYMASFLLSIQYLKIVGGIVLAWIAAKMIRNEDNDDNIEAEQAAKCTNLWSAIRLIIVANLVMCMDNVLAVAAVAGSDIKLLVLGIVVSFPIIMWGSALVAGLLERFPVLLWLGAVFLGWTAGGIIASDATLAPTLQQLGVSHTGLSAFIALSISFIAWKEAAIKNRTAQKNGAGDEG